MVEVAVRDALEDRRPGDLLAPAGPVDQERPPHVRVQPVHLRQQVDALGARAGLVDEEQRDVNARRCELLDVGPCISPRVQAEDVVMPVVPIDELPLDVAPRIVLVDTFKDEAEEALRVAHALGDKLYGIRLDTPSERGRVTAALVTEVRARLDQAGFRHVTITVSGGLTPDRIRYFLDEGAPVDSFAVGSYISGATPIDFTGDIKEIDGSPIAKRGRIPGRTESPRLQRLDLAQWRDA